MTAEAWTEYANQDFEPAILMMEAAAERSTSASALGPGQLLPAAEQLADMYLELGRSREALTRYEAVLARSPNRFNSLCGAARAAEHLGESGQARTHRALLEEVVRDHNPLRDCR